MKAAHDHVGFELQKRPVVGVAAREARQADERDGRLVVASVVQQPHAKRVIYLAGKHRLGIAEGEVHCVCG